MPRTVGEVARIARVSVRTLHHYDEIGLLCPSGRSDANYRMYTSGDLVKLHQILVYRSLGFALDEIRRLVDDSAFDRVSALRRQRNLLAERVRREQRMLDALDALITSETGGPVMTDERIEALFDGFDPTKYEEEVRREWGGTAAYRQSRERTSRYSTADWARFRSEMDEVTREYVTLMDRGVPPEAPEASRVAERHRALIDRWFYDCPPDLFGSLARLWVEDERFTRNIDRARVGLAAYQSAVVRAWVAARAVGAG